MPRVREALTWGLVAVVAGSGLAGLEAWPLTGWRLFSQRRGAVATRYEARVVGVDGTEKPIPFGALAHGFSGSVQVLERMARQRPEQREPTCRAWADETVRVTGLPVIDVRVYGVVDDLRDGTSRATLAWACGARAR